MQFIIVIFQAPRTNSQQRFPPRSGRDVPTKPKSSSQLSPPFAILLSPLINRRNMTTPHEEAF